MKRKIISIDEEKCTGCGLCVTGCPEGALQIIDGKARLVNENFCDGLGACIGECPEGAITVEDREAGPYNEKEVIERIAAQGEAVIAAHLKHLLDHGESEYHRQAVEYLEERGYAESGKTSSRQAGNHESGNDCEETLARGCPGSLAQAFDSAPARVAPAAAETDEGPAGIAGAPATGEPVSQLSHWPVQMHLLNPASQHFKKSDLLLAADCTAYAIGDFHTRFLAGKTLAIACPKLDSGKEIYLEKLTALIDQGEINTITVLMMEVPCCGGLAALAGAAVDRAGRKVPIKRIVLGIRGDILAEEWV